MEIILMIVCIVLALISFASIFLAWFFAKQTYMLHLTIDNINLMNSEIRAASQQIINNIKANDVYYSAIPELQGVVKNLLIVEQIFRRYIETTEKLTK